jgi:hypothetical protein
VTFLLVWFVISSMAAALGLMAAGRGRRQFASAPGAFRCLARVRRGSCRGLRSRWPRRRAYALWVHDVLVIRRGLAGRRIVALPVRLPEEDIKPPADHPRGLGADPLSIALRLDDGAIIDVAAAVQDRMVLVGPFLAAAIPGLPPARVEKRRRR